jgi:hypothetical protein
MIKTIILSMCLAVSSPLLNARAQDERGYLKPLSNEEQNRA